MSFRTLALSLFAATAAHAEVFTLYVAARDSEPAKAAEKLVNDKTAFWFPKLHKGLQKSVELLNGTDAEVRVLVAQGQENGLIEFPDGLNAAKGKLLLLGGHCADWTRKPFECPTEILGGPTRPQPMLSFGGNKTLFSQLVVSGFVFDSAASNRYDAKTNSLLKGQSRTIPILSISGAVTNHLVIADNVFLNGAHRAFEMMVSPMSPETKVDIQNNFFLNNVIPLKFQPQGYRGGAVKTVSFKDNSVILNWPFNPDVDSSNVGALELYHKDCCEKLVLEGNLFAHNPGGAMQHDWPANRMPKLSINKNLFFMNATLWKDARPEAGFFTGKFGPNPKHLVMTAAQVMDDLDYEVKDNVSFDPKVPVALVELGAIDSSGVTAKKTVLNDVRGLFGMNKEGGTVAIKNYAPRMGLDLKNLPFPQEEKAKGYGVKAGQVFVP